MLKSIEEIAREQDGDLLKLVFRTDGTLTLAGADILKFGEAVRRSDRQHWLEVARRAICLGCDLGHKLEGDIHVSEIDGFMTQPCRAFRIRFAFTAQEKP